MNNRKMSCGLVAFYVAAIFLAGCFPEDSLQWSEDGSIGLLRIDGALYIVDGNTGALTEIAKEDVQPWPDISKDGSSIAYSREVECSNLSEGLKLLPAGQAKMIENHAAEMEAKILKGELQNAEFPPLGDGSVEYAGEYKNWVIRYTCEKADQELLEKLGSERVETGKTKEISYYKLIVVPRNDLSRNKVVATGLLRIARPRFSPNGKHLAFLVTELEKPKELDLEHVDLYVASLQKNITAMAVAQYLGLGYDWRPDSQALVYLEAQPGQSAGDLMPGTLEERLVADANDNLLAEAVAVLEQGSVGTHRCTGETKFFAGTLFNPFSKVEYGSGGRVFFSSAALSLPASELDDPRWSLFCYDSATRAIVNVIPAIGSDLVGENVNLFSLSPDRKKVLLMIDKNRFGIYRFSDGWAEVPIEEDEGFGDTVELPPAWKGNDEISCLVSENSHFLPRPEPEGEEKTGRKEVVILGGDGKFRRVLSESWPE